jgi:hypothetical protein
MKKTLLVAGLTLVASSTAFAETPAGVTLTAPYVAMCANTSNVAEQNFCHGFGQGVYDTYLMTRHPKKAPGFVCFSAPGPKRDAVLNQFVTWANQNPQYANMPASDTLLRYLGTTYPCKTAKK